MYGIFAYIYHKNQPNVGKYTIHGSYGNVNKIQKMGPYTMSGLLLLAGSQAALESYKNACTLPETNSSPLKNDGWNASFLLGWPIFRGYVSFREGNTCFF